MNVMDKQKSLIHPVLGPVIVVAIAPAMLFFGAGTAQAQNQDVWWDPWAPGVGLTVHVKDNTGIPAECHYTSTPAPGGNPLNLPTYQHAFHLPAWQTVTWPIGTYDLPAPAIATGTVWNVSVDCGPAGSSYFQQQF